jgi:hypothetical protein
LVDFSSTKLDLVGRFTWFCWLVDLSEANIHHNTNHTNEGKKIWRRIPLGVTQGKRGRFVRSSAAALSTMVLSRGEGKNVFLVAWLILV